MSAPLRDGIYSPEGQDGARRIAALLREALAIAKGLPKCGESSDVLLTLEDAYDAAWFFVLDQRDDSLVTR